MEIEITEKEDLGTIRNTAITVRVEYGKEVFALETVLSEMYENNTQTTDYEVAEFTWLTPPPDSNTEKVKIEEEVEKFILKAV